MQYGYKSVFVTVFVSVALLSNGSSLGTTQKQYPELNQRKDSSTASNGVIVRSSSAGLRPGTDFSNKQNQQHEMPSFDQLGLEIVPYSPTSENFQASVEADHTLSPTASSTFNTKDLPKVQRGNSHRSAFLMGLGTAFVLGCIAAVYHYYHTDHKQVSTLQKSKSIKEQPCNSAGTNNEQQVVKYDAGRGQPIIKKAFGTSGLVLSVTILSLVATAIAYAFWRKHRATV